ncbi:hypothetical protein EC890511_0897, partial [Escherichia coli 89.0511]
GEGA